MAEVGCCPAPSNELLARKVPRAPEIIKTIGTDIGCIPELDGETLLLKIPHALALIIGLEEIMLGLS